MEPPFKNLFKDKKTGKRPEELKDVDLQKRQNEKQTNIQKDNNQLKYNNLENINQFQIISILKDKSLIKENFSPSMKRHSKLVRFYIPYESDTGDFLTMKRRISNNKKYQH